MDQNKSNYDLRSFLEELENRDPHSILRFTEPVGLDFDVTAIAMELEQLGHSPVLWFDKVGESPFPVVTNLYADRQRYALALGVTEESLIETWIGLGEKKIKPKIHKIGPILDVVLTDDLVNLNYLPILKHFLEDGGRYVTNGIIVAKDPDTGIRNASFHRLQMIGNTQFGTSLHSRRHLWNYCQRASERNERLPVSIIIGGHPRFIFGSGLWKGPIEADEYEIVGGFLGQPLDLVKGVTVPVEVPSHAEFVIEGYIIPNEQVREGPFAEFTGYASARSTQHMIEVSAILHRKDAIYQDIVPGISNEHTSLLAVPMEARLLKVLRQNHPNVTGVLMPKSGACRMHAYISIANPAPGQAKNVAAAALFEDLSLKLVVVVDNDIDITSDQEVMWAVCTRMQADADVEILKNCMGAILDPSNRDGLTAKMIIDATKSSDEFPPRHSIPEIAIMRARELIRKYSV